MSDFNCKGAGCGNCPECQDLASQQLRDSERPKHQQPAADLVCRGSLSLGSGCGRCSSCLSQAASMKSRYPSLFPAIIAPDTDAEQARRLLARWLNYGRHLHGTGGAVPVHLLKDSEALIQTGGCDDKSVSFAEALRDFQKEAGSMRRILSRARSFLAAFEQGQASLHESRLGALIEAQAECDRVAGKAHLPKEARTSAAACSSAIRELIERAQQQPFIPGTGLTEPQEKQEETQPTSEDNKRHIHEAVEAAFWKYDSLHKGHGCVPCSSERAAFKQIVTPLVYELAGLVGDQQAPVGRVLSESELERVDLRSPAIWFGTPKPGPLYSTPQLAVPKSWVDELNHELVLETERAIRQRDEYLRTGVSTAGHGGSHDTCFPAILRKYVQRLVPVQQADRPSTCGDLDSNWIEQVFANEGECTEQGDQEGYVIVRPQHAVAIARTLIGDRQVQLDSIVAMCQLIRDSEWAEHVGKGEVGKRVETVITGLLNEISEAREALECTQDLVQLVGQMIQAIRNDRPNSPLAERALDYLKRKRLMTFLRAAPSHDEYIENAARVIYEQWSDHPDYVPWVDGGNSLRQDKARQLAREALDRINPTES
jgi:hypothetical protein